MTPIKSFKRSRRRTMRNTALFLLVAGLAVVEPSNAYSSQSSTSGRRVHVAPLHAEMSSEAMALDPKLQQALESKNASRQKFGLEPLSISQFLELQSQVAAMEQEQVAKVVTQMKPQAKQPQSNGLGRFAKTIFQKTLEDTCYTNFDCESPKVCCDLGFKKMCCSNGMMEVQHEYATVPVPVDMRE